MKPTPTRHTILPGRSLWVWPGDGLPVVAVHGFTGDGLDFEAFADGVRNPVLAVDLVGHGASDAPEATDVYELSRQAGELEALSLALSQRYGPPLWLGYSMGARLSLIAAGGLDAVGLALIGVHPGYASTAEAELRRLSDEALAHHLESERLERESLESERLERFLAQWQSSPLMRSQDTQPEPYRSRRLMRRTQNRAHALAATLRGAGTHTMAFVTEHGARCPVQLFTGAADEKFTGIAAELAGHWPRTTHTVLPGGHACHLEATDALIDAMRPLGVCPA